MNVTAENILTFTNGPVMYCNITGLYPQILEERHIRLNMPLSKMHMNHVGIAYAGSLFVLLEVAGGCLLARCFDPKKFSAIVKNVNISYKRPCNTDFYVEASMTKEEADATEARLEANGMKGEIVLNLEVKNAEDKVVTIAEITFAIIPFTKDFMRK